MNKLVLLIIILLVTVVNIFFAFKNNFVLIKDQKRKIAIILPLVFSILIVLSFYASFVEIVIIEAIITIGVIYYYLRDFSSLFAFLNLSTYFKSLIVLDVLDLLGTFIYNSVLYGNVLKALGEITSLITFIIASYLIVLARGGFVSLATQIALNKNRTPYLGVLGIFGNFGIFILNLLPKRN